MKLFKKDFKAERRRKQNLLIIRKCNIKIINKIVSGYGVEPIDGTKLIVAPCMQH